MIVVRVELWPGGFEHLKETLGVATITNDRTSNHGARGNYVVRAGRRGMDDPMRLRESERAVWRTGTVRNFPRRQRLGWDLVYLALKEIVGSRNP